MNKNDVVLSNLVQLDITKLKDEELNKTAQNISRTLNINRIEKKSKYSFISNCRNVRYNSR